VLKPSLWREFLIYGLLINDEQKEIQRLALEIAKKRYARSASTTAPGIFHGPRKGHRGHRPVSRPGRGRIRGMAGSTPIMNMVIVTEALSRVCAGIALSFAGSALGTLPIQIAGSKEQKQRYLPDIAAGKRLARFALTEPQAGSDAGAISTTARRDGDYYILNGTNSGSPMAERRKFTASSLDQSGKGRPCASCLVVEKGTPDSPSARRRTRWASRASATCELSFQDCRFLPPICWGGKVQGSSPP